VLKCKSNTIPILIDAPDVHFDFLSLFSGTLGKRVEIWEKKCENCIGVENPNTMLWY
jgi:hypothetical protein